MTYFMSFRSLLKTHLLKVILSILLRSHEIALIFFRFCYYFMLCRRYVFKSPIYCLFMICLSLGKRELKQGKMTNPVSNHDMKV